MTVAGGELIAGSIRAAGGRGGVALVPYVTAGFPRKESLREQIAALDAAADVGVAAIEVGVPFTDPMADGGDDSAVVAGGAEQRGGD
jgi:tryptophan synthase alpha chain